MDRDRGPEDDSDETELGSTQARSLLSFNTFSAHLDHKAERGIVDSGHLTHHR